MNIPTKSFYSFSEICSFCDVKPYVLRFWESEFTQLDPITNDTGEKVYDHSDLYAVLKIKKLLFDEKLSVPKAKLRLMEEGVEVEIEHNITHVDDIFNQSAPRYEFEPPDLPAKLESERPVEAKNSNLDFVVDIKKSLMIAKGKINEMRENISQNFQ